VQTNGEWTFEAKTDAQKAAINSLAEGETLTLTYPVQASDGKGGVTTETVTVTITGTNDAPVWSSSDTDESATEDQLEVNYTLSASLAASDADTGDTLTYGMGAGAATAFSDNNARGGISASDFGEFSVDPDTGVWTFAATTAAQKAAINSLAEGERLTLTYPVQASDGKGGVIQETVTVTITGANDAAAITGSLTPTLAEPDTVNWWSGSGEQITPTDPNALSARSAVVDLNFADPDAGDSIAVTISRGGDSITFTANANGEIQSFEGGVSSLNGEWGQLSYNAGQWVYTAFNKADTLNATDGGDSFTITARGSGSAGTAPDSTQTLTVTVSARDDGVAVHSAPFTHGQPSQILGPYLDENTKTDTLDGKLNIMDIDDPDSSLVFEVWNPVSDDYVGGINTAAPGEPPVYTFALKYGTLTLQWEPGTTDLLDGVPGGVTGNEPGAWTYAYQYTALPGSVTLNTSLPEFVRIKAYDPDVPDAKADLNFDVNVITTSYATGLPRPVYDVLRYDLESGETYFGLGTQAVKYGQGNDNLLDNDRTVGGADAASYANGGWNLAPGVRAVAGTTSTEYGVLEVHADGTFDFTPNLNHTNITALGAGESLTVSLPYTMTEVKDGVNTTFTSYLVIQFDGENEAPTAENFRINLTPGWASPHSEEAALNLAEHTSDPDAGDHLAYAFFADADGKNPLEAVPGGSASKTWTTPRTEEGYSYDPDKDGTDGFTQLVEGDHVYKTQHGWLVENNGEFSYVADRTNAEFIALPKGQSLTERIWYTATDEFGESVTRYIDVTVNASADPLITRSFEADDLRAEIQHAVTQEEAAASGGKLEEGQFILHFGADHGKLDSAMANQIQGNLGVAAINIGTLEHAFAQDDNAGSIFYNPTGNFNSGSFATAAVYALLDRNGDGTPEPTRIGSISVQYGTLYFNPSGADGEPGHAAWWGYQGTVTDLYADAACTQPFAVYAFSTGGGQESRQEIPLDIAIKFENDAPVIQSARVAVREDGGAEGRVAFADVDDARNSLVFSVWDDGLNDGAGGWKVIEADNTPVDTGEGTLTVHRDGSYAYEAADPAATATGADTVRVKVSDGTSESEGLLTLVQGQAVPPSLSLQEDTLPVNTANQDRYANRASINVLANDADGDGKGLAGTGATVLNAGVYVFSGKYILPEGAESEWTIPGSGAHPVTEENTTPFLVSHSDRFELKFSDFVLTVAEDGRTSCSAVHSYEVYDRDTGNIYTITSNMSNKEFAEIVTLMNGADPMNPVTVDELKGMLQADFKYHVRDPATGEALESVLHLNFGSTNKETYFSTEYTASNVKSSLVLDALWDYKEGMANNGANVALGQDRNFGDMPDATLYILTEPVVASDGRISFANVSTTGRVQVGAGTVADYIHAQGGTIPGRDTPLPASGGQPLGGDDVIIDIPAFANVGGQAVQVGVIHLDYNSIGNVAQYGTLANGDKLLMGSDSHITGKLTVELFQPDDHTDDPAHAAQLAAFQQSVKDMAEGETRNLLYFGLQTVDSQGATSSPTLAIAVAGHDVILNDNNQPVSISVGEEALLADGQTVDILAGARHTFVNGIDSTDRTDADGWEGFDFGDGMKSVAADGHTVEGQYGRLVWDADAREHVYKVYDPADATLTDAQRAAGAAVRGLTGGQTLSETFNYTVHDKNGESDTGRTVITVEGTSDGFVVNIPGVQAGVIEGDILNVNLGEFISTQDKGTIRYYIEYTDPNDESHVVSTYGKPAADMEPIDTLWGRLVFSPSTGVYTFTPNGTLQAGQTQELGIRVMAEITTGDVVQSSGWMDYDIEITGVNDKPVMAENFFFASTNAKVGALAWTDIDNDVEGQSGRFVLDARTADVGGVTVNGIETVAGEYGVLELNTAKGSYTYSLNDDAFSGGEHRVVDTFKVKVTDPGSDGEGADAATSEEADLTVYGVDGLLFSGGTGVDTFNPSDGKAHIFYGGAGGDIIDLGGTYLTGDGRHENILIWNKGDAGDEGATDTIKDFTKGDILDLRGILDGRSAGDSISFTVEGDDLKLDVLANSTDKGAAAPVTQSIVLEGAKDLAGGLEEGNYSDLLNMQIHILTNS
jgi:VCBS repeat-containing protein